MLNVSYNRSSQCYKVPVCQIDKFLVLPKITKKNLWHFYYQTKLKLYAGIVKMRKFIAAGNVKKKKAAFFVLMVAVILSACSPAKTKTAKNSVEQSLFIDVVETKSRDSSIEKPEDPPIAVTETPEELSTMEETAGELSEDAVVVKSIAEEFCTAYFDGNIEEINNYLAGSYEGDISVLNSAEEVSDISVKGLAKIKNAQIGDGYTVYCEFKLNAQSDTFQYLTIEFIKQEDGWKAQSYSLEL